MTEARMQENPHYQPGTFCWVELGTTDGEGAKKFYTELFGWTFVDNPMGPDMVYTMLKLDDQVVGALYQMSSEMTSQGIPANWLQYVAVENADESAAKAKELGATLMKEPFDVMEFGKMSVIQDPTGAVFAIWQAGTHPGAAVFNVPGSQCWNELATSDTAKDGEFYADLFGWSKETMNMGPMEYTMFANNSRGAGGMFKLTPEMAGIPPHWLAYFAVDDCDAAVKKATELGASTMKPADDIPGIGRFAILRDPQNAVFAVIKLDNNEGQPPQG